MMTCPSYMGQVIVFNEKCLVIPNTIGVRGKMGSIQN